MTNRKGASLITLLIMFSVLFVSSLAFLSFTSAGHRLRIHENKVQFALYAAETGLDKLEYEIINTFLNEDTGIYVVSATNAVRRAEAEAGILRSLLEEKRQLFEWEKMQHEIDSHQDEFDYGDANSNINIILRERLEEEIREVGTLNDSMSQREVWLYHYIQSWEAINKIVEYFKNENESRLYNGGIRTSNSDEEVVGHFAGMLDINPFFQIGDNTVAFDLNTQMEDFLEPTKALELIDSHVMDMANDYYIDFFNRQANSYISNILAHVSDIDDETRNIGSDPIGRILQRSVDTESRLRNRMENNGWGLAGNQDVRLLSISIGEDTTLRENIADDSDILTESIDNVSLEFVANTKENTILLDELTREITAVFNIRRPELFSQHLFEERERINIPDNILYSKALSTQSSLIFSQGSTATIIGDVYAVDDIILNGDHPYGEPTEITMRASAISGSGTIVADGRNTEGGIINAGHNIELTIEGTRNIEQDIFVRNLKTIGTGTDRNIEYNIIGNLYTFDDIELNANNSIVDIQGSYYGYSRGGTRTVGGNTRPHNTSSSIVINSPDLVNYGVGSSLSITGGDIIIAGTSYIEDIDDIDGVFDSALEPFDGYYQTGESVSIKGNYIGYSFPIFDDEDHDYYFKKVMFGQFPPLIAAYRFVDREDRDPMFEPYEKAEYLIEANSSYQRSWSNDNEPLLNLNGVTLGIADYIHEVGREEPRRIIHGAYIDTETNGDDKTPVINSTNGAGFQFDFEQWFTGEIESSIDKAIKNLGSNVYYGGNVIGVDGAVTITESNRETRGMRSDDNSIIVYMVDSDVSISRSDLSSTFRIPGGKASIVLVATGDVTIGNELELMGTIVAGGNITVHGNSTIVSNRNRVIQLLATDKFYSENPRDPSERPREPVASVFSPEGYIDIIYNEGSFMETFTRSRETTDVFNLVRWSWIDG